MIYISFFSIFKVLSNKGNLYFVCTVQPLSNRTKSRRSGHQATGQQDLVMNPYFVSF